jgi:hypothetical protein
MTENIPVITVTCIRDLPLLDLQAQGVYHYLDKNTPVYLVVNEPDATLWFEFFDKNIRHYYRNHQLKIIIRESFNIDWTLWTLGWETQQLLKLVIAIHLNSKAFFICDTQNFLIKSWSTTQYTLPENKIPYRKGPYYHPDEVWRDYSNILQVDVEIPTSQTILLCTPIFMHTQLVQDLINNHGGVDEFSKWFKQASRKKSEFVLYAIWAHKHGGIEQLHHQVDNWAEPYLRDCKTNKDFFKFIEAVGAHASNAWISSNHRAWGNMTDEQYFKLKEKLEKFNLKLNFDEYRSKYHE